MVTVVSDANAIRAKLREWSVAKKLSQAKLEAPEAAATTGTAAPSGDYHLVLENDRLLSTVKLTIDWEGKSCQYSVGSIYLQIVDPDQRLLAYRGACKHYKVADPIKATDKATVVGFFLEGSNSSSTAADAAAAAGASAVESAVTAEEQGAAAVSKGDEATSDKKAKEHDKKPSSSEDRDHHHRSKEHRDRHHKSSSKHRGDHRKDHHHKSSSSRHKSSSSHHKDGSKRSSKDRHGKHGHKDTEPPKKKPKTVTSEELFSNLDVVVGKRTTETTAPEDPGAALDSSGASGVTGIMTPVDPAAEAAERKSKELVTQALSADGFNVTPELLEENRAKTQLILAQEIPVGNSASILRAANPRKDLSRVLEIFNETMAAAAAAAAAAASSSSTKSKSGKPGPPSSSRKNPSAAISGSGSPSKKKSYLVGKKPVIIVPKGMTAPITMINAKEFFETGRFVPRDVMLKKQRQQKSAASGKSPGGGGAGGNATTFTRTVRAGGTTGLVEYEIIDSPKKLGSNAKDWERIVAVIVLGQGWQFKDWYHNYGNPVHLFHKTFGFFISMEGDKLPAEIQGWSVQQAKLNRDKRGMDSVTYASFWNGLDEWMAVHKRELLPQAADA